MPRKKAKTSRPLAFRLPDELVSEIEEYRQELEKQSPWTRVSTSDVIRLLLRRGLDTSRT